MDDIVWQTDADRERIRAEQAAAASRPRVVSQTELAWAAGFFDGEGWTSPTNVRGSSAGRSFQIGVGQKDREALERFVRAVGVGRISAERENTFHSWRASSAADQLQAITRLWPYLSSPKKTQAREVLTRVRAARKGMTRAVASVESAYDAMEGVMSS